MAGANSAASCSFSGPACIATANGSGRICPVMPRSSSSRPIVIRRRMHFRRSACRARRSSAESLDFGGEDGGGSEGVMSGR